MAQGNAARVRRYVRRKASDARRSGELEIAIATSDVRDALNLPGEAVLTDINQALQTQKLEREAGVEFVCMTGLGRDSVYRFRV